METLSNLFKGKSAVRKLMALPRCEDCSDKYAEKAIEHLVKKLKRRPEDVDELVRAIANPGAPSRCVTILRNLDGRLQIDRKKNLPHVVYCRLWRWGDLPPGTQLTSLPCCRHPHAQSRDPEICVNPFHYERIKRKNFVVMVPKQLPPCSPTEPGHLAQPSPNQSMPQNVGLFQTSPTMSYSSQYSQGSSSHDSEMDCSPQHHANAPCSEFQSAYPQKQSDVVAVALPEQCDWSRLVYFEMNTRVGEAFFCVNDEIWIDGFTSTGDEPDRFSIGRLSNVHRHPASERVRMAIGNGVRLSNLPAQGEVYLHCLSDYPIFVQSPCFNCASGYAFGTVVKVNPQEYIRLFDLEFFKDLLSRSVSGGYQAVFELTKLCTTRVSFVKGWGTEYHRNDVTMTPAWIEIQLNSPLKWLDKVLMTMPTPADYVSSVS